MKHVLFFILAFVLAIVTVSAQVPQQINYQAVVRNSAGQPVSNGTVVTVKFIIHDSTATGTTILPKPIQSLPIKLAW